MRKILRSRSLEGMVGLIESYGHNADMLARRVGLTQEALYRPDLIINDEVFNDLLEEAAQVCNDRFFALKLAQLQGFDVLGPLWPLIRSANTVGEALQLLVGHLEFFSQAISAYLAADNTGTSLCYEVRRVNAPTRPRHTGRVQVIELGLAASCYALRRLLGNSWRPEFAQFRHGAPECLSPLHEVFGKKLNFNQDVNAIHFPRADYERPLPTLDINLELARRELDASMAQEIPFTLRVDRIIRILINGEGCSVRKVADTLGMSPRTMQYQLKQHNTSYQALYDYARVDLAKHYLKKSDLSIGAITERLYFADTAAFSRFFKVKTGISPRQYITIPGSSD